MIPAPAAAAPVYPAARTRFNPTRAPHGGWGALDVETWDTARDNPMIKSLEFIRWQKPAAPHEFSSPAYILQGVLIAPLSHSSEHADTIALKGATIVVDVLPAVLVLQPLHMHMRTHLFSKSCTKLSLVSCNTSYLRQY